MLFGCLDANYQAKNLKQKFDEYLQTVPLEKRDEFKFPLSSAKFWQSQVRKPNNAYLKAALPYLLLLVKWEDYMTEYVRISGKIEFLKGADILTFTDNWYILASIVRPVYAIESMRSGILPKNQEKYKLCQAQGFDLDIACKDFVEVSKERRYLAKVVEGAKEAKLFVDEFMKEEYGCVIKPGTISVETIVCKDKQLEKVMRERTMDPLWKGYTSFMIFLTNAITQPDMDIVRRESGKHFSDYLDGLQAKLLNECDDLYPSGTFTDILYDN